MCALNKVLIAYFSRKGNNYVSGVIENLPIGNTQVVAQKIQQLTDGTLFEIKTEHVYALDYTLCTKEAQQELKHNARPALVGVMPDISKYDRIILAYPNWWGTMPMGVFTFLEKVNLTGKKVFPLCTHEGSGMGESEKDLKKACLHGTVGQGLAIYGSRVNLADTDEKIAKWLKIILKED